MTINIPGLDTLYEILKRHIEVGNDNLEARKKLAADLYDSCHKWSRILIDTFNQAVGRWEQEGRNAAADEILQLERDFHRIDYFALKENSPILVHLAEDTRFEEFSGACSDFYKSALSVKRLVYGDIKNEHGEYILADETSIDEMVSLWRKEVELMLEKVSIEWMKIQVLEKR
jgi:AraC-like DNA-binding protein